MIRENMKYNVIINEESGNGISGAAWREGSQNLISEKNLPQENPDQWRFTVVEFVYSGFMY